MSGTVSIVFTGLCALVAGGNGRPAQVLLPDAREIGEVSGMALPEHAPTLVASLSALANPETSGPTRVVTAWPGRGSAAVPGRGFGVPEQVGMWDLRGTEVRIKAQGEDGAWVEIFRPSQGKSSWPMPPRGLADPLAWRDIRFVPDMKALTGDGRIDPALVATGDATPTALPQRVAARVFLDGGRLEAGMPSQKIFRDRVFEFRSAGTEPKLRQALTDAVVWSLDSGSRTVVVEIAPLDGGPVKRLVLAQNGTPHELFISNLPAENVPDALHHAMSEDEMAALHFGAYYELLQQPPADRPLPRLVPRPRKAVGLMGTTMCPPALFAQP
jgi:hypothetical protein